jgi:hypothetical protein
MTPSGGFWSLLTIIGPVVLGLAILWALLKNRKEPRSEIERTEHAAHDRILEQDAIDKQRDHKPRS